MADCEEREITPALKGFMESFLWASKRLAAPLLKPFGPSSEPACIDEEDLEKLKQRLDRIRATFVVAETREIKDESQKLWLKELRELERSAEDIIEELEFESLRTRTLQELEMELRQSGTRKRKHEVRTTFSSLPNSSLARKFQKIRERYDEIAYDRKSLRLREADGMRRPEGPVRPPSSSLVEGDLYGRRADMKTIIRLVLSDGSLQRDSFSVIPIVGMGGVGKTTLVQHVYNNEKVASHFHLKTWVCASQDFDVIRITRAIVEGVTRQYCDLTELSVLQQVLAEKLKGRRFLLVLDDVWNQNSSYWESLLVPLNDAARGSKVILTTRNAGVANLMRMEPIRHLGCLSDQDCWLVCQRHTFNGQDPSAYPNLIDIGKVIVAKCKGLPLAAKALGGLLRTALNEAHWSGVMQSELWQMDELQNSVLPVLKLSYNHLPMHLKRCFEYCSLFPKGYVFEREKLVRLWMAQGFIEPYGRSQLEDIGNKYFDELIERAFFQPSPFCDHMYLMHDLFHELAQSLSGDEYCRSEDYRLCEVHERARYLSLVPHESHFEKVIQFESFDGQDLRTFLFVGRMECKLDEISFLVKIPNNIFLLLESLRALDLSNTNIEELPISIGNLKHLRYLGLQNTRIRRLPESACSLFNIQTLNLKCSYRLQELPIGTRFLFRLRHLEVPLTNIYMPSGIGKLTDLQTLPIFIVGNGREHCGLGELKNLIQLGGDLHISGLGNVVNAWDANEANMKNKEGLKKLTLQWLSPDRSFLHLDDTIVSEVLERLQPHPNLEMLVIRDYCGIRFAEWMGDPIFSKLVSVSLKDCGKCRELPPLGQLPALRHLTVQSMAGVQSVGHEFCGNPKATSVGHEFCGNPKARFPNLKTLTFRKMHEWKTWTGVEDGDFPILESLTISGCCKLMELPRINLRKKLKLKVTECPKLHISKNVLPLTPQGDEIYLTIIQSGTNVALEEESQILASHDQHHLMNTI